MAAAERAGPDDAAPPTRWTSSCPVWFVGALFFLTVTSRLSSLDRGATPIKAIREAGGTGTRASFLDPGPNATAGAEAPQDPGPDAAAGAESPEEAPPVEAAPGPPPVAQPPSPAAGPPPVAQLPSPAELAKPTSEGDASAAQVAQEAPPVEAAPGPPPVAQPPSPAAPPSPAEVAKPTEAPKANAEGVNASAAQNEFVMEAMHKGWSDNIYISIHGNFWRAKVPKESGRWSIWDNVLIMKWHLWDAEKVRTTDGGKSFSDGTGFTLESEETPPTWFTRQIRVPVQNKDEFEVQAAGTDWDDHIVIKKDGSFKRRSAAGNGFWHLQGSKLTLEWFGGDELTLLTTDGGNSFRDENGFSLHCDSPPPWFLARVTAGPASAAPHNSASLRRVAILISGQQHRFLWQDSFSHAGGIKSLFGCKEEQPCEITVDVHVLLGTAKVGSFVLPAPMWPPYSNQNLEDLDKEAVKKHFKASGASTVSIRLLPPDFEGIHEYKEKVKELAAEQHQMSGGSWWKNRSMTIKFDMRWSTNGNMLLLRHMVYLQALREEVKLGYTYDEFLYVRDDNVFWVKDFKRPTMKKFPSSKHPVAMVDSFCGFGSYSDKMYLVNRQAADILFPNKGFEGHLLSWLNYGVKRRESTQLRDNKDPLQSEAWLQHWLRTNKVSVERHDFGRTDMRYVGTDRTALKLCTPKLYYKCMNDQLHKHVAKCEVQKQADGPAQSEDKAKPR